MLVIDDHVDGEARELFHGVSEGRDVEIAASCVDASEKVDIRREVIGAGRHRTEDADVAESVPPPCLDDRFGVLFDGQAGSVVGGPQQALEGVVAGVSRPVLDGRHIGLAHPGRSREICLRHLAVEARSSHEVRRAAAVEASGHGYTSVIYPSDPSIC